MNNRIAIAAASVSFLVLLSGCSQHKQTASVPAQARAPAVAAAHTMLLVKRVGPAHLYPDAKVTTGKADTLVTKSLIARYTTNCPDGKDDCTYSQSHRDVSDSVHAHVYDEYKVSKGKRNIQAGEVDHLYPLCAGGSNDITNLWYQPAQNKWKGKNFGYHEKDNLETRVCKQIKAGTLDPKLAYQRITQDWVAYYLDEHLDKSSDGEDEDVN
jgi:hypothetical protein